MTFAASQVAAEIVSNLASYGIQEVAFYDIPETRMTALRMTDQPFNDIDLVNMIAADIVEPCGVEISMVGSNSRYANDDKIGGVIIFRPI